MCEHHACYHDDGPENTGEVTIVGTPRLASTPQITSRQSGGYVSEDHTQVGRQKEDIPDTLQWAQYVRSGSNLGLPAIPSQCLLPSDTASVVSGSQASYLRPFGGHGLNTLSHLAKQNTGPNNPAPTVYEDSNGNPYMQSLTEVFTPSVRASQDAIAEADFGKNLASVQGTLEKFAQKNASQKASQTITKEDSVMIKQSGSNDSVVLPNDLDETYLLPRIRHIVNHLVDVPEKLRNHEDRLDHLENSNDADEYLDTRVGELEERVVEIEKQQAVINDAGSVSSRQLIDGSFSSRTSSAMISSAMDRIDASRVEALEAQVAELQASALPSYSRPWEVEVVFLPFGHRLMGVWSSQHGVSQRLRLNSTDDWTQTPHQSIAADQASSWERSATDMAQGDKETWKMAKACGMRSRVDERLRSRGLVKTIQIFGPDARDVQAAIMTAFGDLPNTLTTDPYSQRDDENAGTVPKTLKNYLGLSAPWIPLRKLHKDSCLRFLTPSEMVTPALWTTTFLSSSVAMRHSNTRRLYVTHRDSYIQHLGRQNSDWTWAKLRQLPRTYPYQHNTETPEADAAEPCWEFDDRLDPAHESVHSSFASSISQLSIGSSQHAQEGDFAPQSPSDHFSSAAISPRQSITPTSLIAPTRDFQSSPLKERNPFRPVRIRTTSMPTLVPTKFSQPKRRITSFDPDHDEESEPSPTRLSLSSCGFRMDIKRRRTRSPSRSRDTHGNTPMYSAGPPSPYTNTTNVGSDEVYAAGMRNKEKEERGNTPFAYATPYSNAPYIEPGPRSVVDVYEDSDQDPNYEDEKGSTTDDAWANDERDPEENAFSVYDEDETIDEAYGGMSGNDKQNAEWNDVRDLDETLEYPPVVDEAGMSFYQDRQVEDDEASDASDASDTPSEYPSTQPFGVAAGVQSKVKALSRESLGMGERGEFQIHVDDDGGEGEEL